MKCPYCGQLENKVLDSRLAGEQSIIRRRRVCESCDKRFTTYERVEEILPFIVKKDGRREAFDRLKILSGLKKACEKRPISLEQIEELIQDIESQLMEKGEKEIPSHKVGEALMKALAALDQVAYVRFASVYRSFKDVGEFVDLIKNG